MAQKAPQVVYCLALYRKMLADPCSEAPGGAGRGVDAWQGMCSVSECLENG